MQKGTTVTSKVYCKTLKKLHRAIQNKRHGKVISSIVLPHDYARSNTAACTWALLEHFNWELFDHPLTALIISRQVTTSCLPIWRSGWDYSTSTIMRSWWKVSKHGCAHRQQMFSTQAYRNLCPNATSASIPAVTTLRSSLSMYIFYVYVENLFFSLLVFLTAHQRLLSE
jgi:hypothetical protein